MNYVSDEECWPPGVGEFTCGQYERMYMQWLLYRQSNEPCQRNEEEIQILIKASPYITSNLVFYLTYLDTGEMVFNSTRDFEALGSPYQTEVKSDFCAPTGKYSLVLFDVARDGFLNSIFAEVSVDGKPVGRISGSSLSGSLEFGISSKGSVLTGVSIGGTTSMGSSATDPDYEPVSSLVDDRKPDAFPLYINGALSTWPNTFIIVHGWMAWTVGVVFF
jgi:hypothetical protein